MVREGDVVYRSKVVRHSTLFEPNLAGTNNIMCRSIYRCCDNHRINLTQTQLSVRHSLTRSTLSFGTQGIKFVRMTKARLDVQQETKELHETGHILASKG